MSIGVRSPSSESACATSLGAFVISRLRTIAKKLTGNIPNIEFLAENEQMGAAGIARPILIEAQK
jgi:hypothetical protein